MPHSQESITGSRDLTKRGHEHMNLAVEDRPLPLSAFKAQLEVCDHMYMLGTDKMVNIPVKVKNIIHLWISNVILVEAVSGRASLLMLPSRSALRAA
jgi:hypothetical protein